MKRIAVILLALLSVFVLCACSGKTAITKDRFKIHFQSEFFSVEDLEDTEDAYHTDGLIAYTNNMIVEFSVHGSNSEAKAYIEAIADNISTKAFFTEVNAANYKTITFEDDGYYYMMTSVDKTAMFGLCPSDNKSDLINHFEALGYK